MSAARYFGLRDRLAGVMAGVDALARETGTGAGVAARLDPETGPWAPFRVMACGEVNTGKSSLLNAWCGAALCAAGPLPTTRTVQWYRHGPQSADHDRPDGLRESRRPLAFLKDIELLDTPGLNMLDRPARGELALLASRVDLVLVVFAHSNPWEPSTWEWVEHLPANVLEKVLLVVQQGDRFDEADVPVVLGHVRELSRKRTGRELPVVVLSAAQAQAACRSQPPDARLWQASGFGLLLDFFAQRVCGSSARMAALRQWHAMVVEELRAVDERLDGQARSVDDEARFLAWMESAVDSDRERVTTALCGRLEGYEEVVRDVRRWLRRRLGVFVSFLRVIAGDRTSGELDRALIERVAAAARRQAQADAGRMVTVCRERWDGLAGEVTERLGMVMRPFPEIEPVLVEKAARFAERFGEAAVAAAEDVRAGVVLGPDFRRRLSNLGWWFACALVFATAAGIAGAMMVPLWPWILLGGAGTVWCLTSVIGWLSRRRLAKDLEDLLVAAQAGLVERLRRDAVDGIRSFFADFARQLDPVRRRVARARFSLKPAQERAGGLYVEAKAFEQDMRRWEDESF